MKIGILGGGLAGLSLGYFLNRDGSNFLILEKTEETGGLLKSVEVDGFTFDVGGSHIIFSKDKKILNFMVSLLGTNVLKNRRNTKIFYKGHYVKYPFENGLADLPKEDNFECLYYFVQNLIEKKMGKLSSPRNMKEWFYYTFGKGIAEKYLIPYNEKIWKFPLENMSTAWVERIPQPPVDDIIKSSLGIPTEGYTHQLYFYYPKFGGIQSLARSLEAPITDRIVTNFKVKKIKKEDSKWIVSNGKKEFEFDKLISTLPLQELIQALRDVPKEILEAVDNLKYNSLITVGIGIDKPRINDFSWVYIPDKEILTHRVSFPSNYSPYVVPQGKSSVLAEITYREGDEISKMKDKEIIERTVEDLDKLKIINKKDVILAMAYKFKYAYVIYDTDYMYNLETIFRYLTWIGIDSLGRFGRWDYINMDSVIKSAMEYVDSMK
ncbi:protoporphyrinogen/coproporphyrinogen oxidase [Thermococcus alcaliphilus]|uniref:protoporphyrinogen/coproporphyrinogen oxidase n=1 Tax=Thermococcus alcaliphilus TaxID=139207 RepID=UPI0020917E90|nr:FAD-dependent oxidoreductase [Thermococcus alcaliphilus]MCO6042259.1 FAD-dependent oxidoreductase [Thermococcus alcaliphilus]